MPNLFNHTTILIVAAFSLFLAACTGIAPVAPLPSPVTQTTESSLPAQATAALASRPAEVTVPVAPVANSTVTAIVSSATAATTAATAPAQASTTPQPSTTAAADVTLACTPGALTPAETEGPYYKANPPQDASLVQADMAGITLTITGYVFNAKCQPITGARVDFWQADSEGQYDNSGYTLRGYQLTDAQGRYTVETVVPGIYPGRTRHIHVKVTPPNGATLTTQLYFPGEPLNSSDGIFNAASVLNMPGGAGGNAATFNFVVAGG
jgi:protocatechuate 3,4-dioxygenase beta subunit